MITAGDGKAHVSSADDGVIYAGILGPDCYVCATGNMLAIRMETANKATIDTGSGSMYGRAWRIAIPESVTIQSGTQAQRRNDIIGIRFITSANGEENGRLEVIKGTPTSGAEASDPSVPSSSMLDGATTGWMSLYRIKLDGIAVAEPEPLFNVLAPMSKLQADLAEVRDSVSQTVLVPCAPASGVPANAISVLRYGRVVHVRVVGSLGVRGGMWDAINLASGLPKPDVSEAYAAGIAQGVASPLLLRVDWNGNLGIRGAGVTGWNGGWLFASFTYLSA